MKIATIAVCASLIAGAVQAEDETGKDGLSLMQQGALLFLDGLQKQVEPALEGLDDLANETGPALREFTLKMGPALGDILSRVEDWSVYEAPQMLDNGDIVIRRKQPPAPAPQDIPDSESTDL